jgi:hypothetical protein
METARANAAPACTTNAGIVTDILAPTKNRECRSISSATTSTTYLNKLQLRVSSLTLMARATGDSGNLFRCQTATICWNPQPPHPLYRSLSDWGAFTKWPSGDIANLRPSNYSVAARIAPCSQIAWFIFYLMSGRTSFGLADPVLNDSTRTNRPESHKRAGARSILFAGQPYPKRLSCADLRVLFKFALGLIRNDSLAALMWS